MPLSVVHGDRAVEAARVPEISVPVLPANNAALAQLDCELSRSPPRDVATTVRGEYLRFNAPRVRRMGSPARATLGTRLSE